MIFSACGKGSQGTDRQVEKEQKDSNQVTEVASAGEVVSYPIPQENRASAALYGYCPSTTSDGYYTVSTIVHYYDREIDKSVILCAQTGCTHSDETCQAWVGEVITYVEYQGYILATIRYQESGAQLIKKDISTGEITVLDTWSGNSDESYEASLGRVADNLAVIALTCYRSTGEEENYQILQYRSAWLYDLVSGEKKELFPEGQYDDKGIMTISKNYMLVLVWPEDATEGLMDTEAFYATYGENSNYSRYCQRTEKYELRVYDLATGEFRVVADTEQDHLVRYSDFLYAYGKQALYQCGDTLYLFDMDNGQSTAVLSMEGIVNYWLQDHKVFTIVLDSVKEGGSIYAADDTISIYWMDMDGGPLTKLGNAGNTSTMEFNTLYECDSFFVGYYKGGYYIITKADFYADEYGNVKLIG
jgi:hypothetical protein